MAKMIRIPCVDDHPLMRDGVSKAAGDAMALGDCLVQGLEVPEALKRYDDLRRRIGLEIASYGRQLGAAFGATL